MTRSLRLRLLIGTSLATTAVLALLGLSIYFFTWRSLTAQFDAAMLTKAHALASMVEQDGGKVTFDYDPKDMPEFLPARHAEYFQVWLDDGTTLARSVSLGGKDLGVGGSTPHASTLPDGHRGRSLTLAIAAKVQQEGDEPAPPTPPTARRATLSIAMPTRAIEEPLEQLAAILTTLCGGAVLISGLTLLWVVHRTLRPVAQLARDIGSLRETDLSGRLSPADVPTELTPVVDKLNELFERVAAAFGREKAFTADAAHELRTPLAGLRTTIEVCRSRPREAPEYALALDKCGAIAARMEGMIASLLMLARAEGGQLPMNHRELDLAELAAECWVMSQPAAERRGLSVTWHAADPCVVMSDPDKLRIVLQNLLNNAASHCNERGDVRIACRSAADVAVLEITNTGSAVAAVDVPHLSKRFWRGDSSRADTGVHCGLGLSVSQRLADLMGGSIELSSEGGLFTVRLTVPATPRRLP